MNSYDALLIDAGTGNLHSFTTHCSSWDSMSRSPAIPMTCSTQVG